MRAMTTMTKASAESVRAATGRLAAAWRRPSSRPAGSGGRRTRVSEMRLSLRTGRLLSRRTAAGPATPANKRRNRVRQLRRSG